MSDLARAADRAAGRTISASDLVARMAIATNLARHSRGVDRNDLALLLSAYHPDATVAYGMFEGQAADFAAFLTDAMAGAAVTLHRTSNMLIHVEDDRAHSESYVIAYTRTIEPDGSQVQRLIGGRYLDRHERRDGAWRIAHRIYVLEWNMNLPMREAAAAMSDDRPRGAQRDTDPSAGWFAGHETKGASMDGIEEAIAKQALHDLVANYARAADRADEALMASVFHPDAEIVTGVIDARAPDYARDITAMVRTNLKSTFHSVANEYFEVDGDTAKGEVYVLAHMIAGEDETLTGGRYLDRYEKRDGTWKIAHRTFLYDWSRTQPATAQVDGMYESLTTRGGYAPGDPSVAFWGGSNPL